MAHYLIEEDENTCNYTKTPMEPPPSKVSHSLLQYLTKYKLPVQHFINNGIEWTDLQNLNETYFKGFCDDLKLNTVQSLRFKKLIHELNQHNESQTNSMLHSKEHLQRKFKLAECQIVESVDRMMTKLTNRKHELLDQLQQIRAMNSIHVQYTCDEAKLTHNIESFGTIDDTPNYLKSPRISCTADARSIRVDIQNPDQYPYSFEIKEMDSNCGHNSSWSIIHNTNIIQHLNPLTTYHIRARFEITAHLCSSYSKEMEVCTSLDIAWDISQHTKTKHVELINPYKLCCNSKCGTVCLVANPVLSNAVLKCVTFEFIFEAFCQTSMFGFIPTPIHETMSGYWTNKVMAMNKHGHILETMDGLATVHRYTCGVDTEKGMFSNPGILLPEKIKVGDRFIFDVDFDKHQCNVYLNKYVQTSKIIGKSGINVATWENVPNQIVPVYGHSVGSRFIQKNSVVTIKVISFLCR